LHKDRLNFSFLFQRSSALSGNNPFETRKLRTGMKMMKMMKMRMMRMMETRMETRAGAGALHPTEEKITCMFDVY
jgi:hypothetical protein